MVCILVVGRVSGIKGSSPNIRWTPPLWGTDWFRTGTGIATSVTLRGALVAINPRYYTLPLYRCIKTTTHEMGTYIEFAYSCF